MENLEISQIQKNLQYLKQKYWVKSSQSLKLLALMVKRKRNTNYINAFKNSNGHMVTNPNVIVKELAKYYENLYTSTKPVESEIDHFLKEKSLFKRLSQDHKHFLDSPIGSKEIMEVIREIKNNKSPGPDGYPIEFYKSFSTNLVPIL